MVVDVAEAYFADLESSCFSDGLKKLEHRLADCIELKEDYAGKWKNFVVAKIDATISYSYGIPINLQHSIKNKWSKEKRNETGPENCGDGDILK